jgi:putative oxidoreductase
VAGKIILLALRTALAWTFIHAGAIKIWDFAQARPATPDFVVAIQQYRLLPSPDLAVLIAVYLPWVEIFAALGLFIRRVQLGAALVIAGLTGIFMTALASAWARGLRIECGCFGRDSVSTDVPALLIRDACILLAALVLLFRDTRPIPAHDGPMVADEKR